MKKNDKKSFLEKTYKEYGYITVLLVALVMHLVIYFFSISDAIGIKKGILIFCIWAFGICISRYLYLYYNNCSFNKRESDSFKLTKGWKGINIIRSDKNQYYKVLSDIVDVWDITSGGSFSFVYAIKYKFKDENQKEFLGQKRIGDWNYIFSPSLPKAGDKIEILYNKNDPTDSIIFYQKAKKTKWYQWQSKYEIKVIKQ